MVITSHLDQPVSACESVFSQLSVLSWQRGASTFFTDHIPFSWSNGASFGNQILAYLKLIRQCYSSDSVLTCYELGTGLGRLFPYVSSQLKQESEFQNVQFYSNYFFQSMIQSLQKDRSIDPACSVQFDQFSFDSFDFSKVKSYQLVVLSFLIQSLPHSYLVWNKGKFQEEKVISRLNGRPLMATNLLPFQAIDSSDIMTWLIDQESDVVLNHLARIRDCFTEELVLTECDFLSKEEVDLLTAYFEEKQISYCRFNYAKSAISLLKNFFNYSSDRCLFLIQDVGDMGDYGIPDDASRVNTYGVCQLAKVYFPLIRFIAEKFKFLVNGTSFNSDEIQQMVVYKGIPQDELNHCFDQFTQYPFLSQERQLKKSIYQAALFLNGDKFKDKVLNLIDVPKAGVLSCEMNLFIADYFYSKGGYLESLSYADQVVDYYGDFAIMAKLIQAKNYISTSQLNKAKHVLIQAIEVAPFVSDLYLYLSVIYLKRKKYDAFIDTMKGYLSCVQCDIDWNHMFTFLIVLAYHCSDKVEFEGFYESIKFFIKQGYFSISPEIANRFIAFELEYSQLV